jgi:hypothetical protein
LTAMADGGAAAGWRTYGTHQPTAKICGFAALSITKKLIPKNLEALSLHLPLVLDID